LTPVKSAKGRCVALSGTLRELAKAAKSGIVPQRAVFVMHGPDSAFMTEADRDLLWESFQVPVLACLLDGDGRLVAYECEAQDGLHIPMICPTDANRRIISNEDSILGYRLPLDQAVVEALPCECGRPGQRLRYTGARPPGRRLEVVRTT
jgi:hypothetical protein